MNKYFIYQYITKINKDDIINFSNKLGIYLNQNDLEVIYFYIKNEYIRFFDNPQEIIDEVKGKISDNVYIKLLELYNKYKDKIS